MTDESVFAVALDIGSPTERAAYLDRACAGNPALRREVEQLLAAHAASNPLDRPPRDVARTGAYETVGGNAVPTAVVGDRVGAYKLLERIGEGGMGEVWVADQLEPIKRRVALKLIKPGMDSRSVLGRFEAERQALAVMDHPNIAKVLDAGTTTDGRPFFVMELVKGTPITEFCDVRKLTPNERLELFVPVCLAIQHAHMKGIIHRDIKPSNVLVELHDDRAVAKVIDFGVAKAIGQQLTERTIYTGFGALVGTPAYMAPEQATFNALDVDTRADVYALGVLLYELLAGSPPIESERMKRAALDEILRIVRDEQPPRPSQRLSTSQAKATIAATRQSDPLKLSQLMKGELDWIVMKALEKDRSRRYDTPTALAKDVQRYLSGDAVEACPPTLGYRLKKAYLKNRVTVRVAGAFVCLAVGAAVMGSVLAVHARRAEAAALAERDRSRAAEARVEEEAAVAREINDFFCSEVFGQANPARYGDKDLKVRTVLEAIAPQIGPRFGTRPRAEATVRHAIGDGYLGLGEFGSARPHLERAYEIRRRELGDRHADTLASQCSLAFTLISLEPMDRPREMLADVARTALDALGPDHPITADAHLHWGLSIVDDTEALKLIESAVPVKQKLYGETDPRSLEALAYLASRRVRAGQFDAAGRDIARGLAIVDRLPDKPATHVLRGNFLFRRGDLELCLGRYPEAVKTLTEGVREQAGALGDDHVFVNNTRLSLGFAQMLAGDTATAVATLADTERRYLKQMNERSYAIGLVRYHLAHALLRAGRARDALPLARAAQEVIDRDGWAIEKFHCRAVLGACLTANGHFPEAEHWLLAAHDVPRPTFPGYRPVVEDADRWTFELYREWDKPEEAVKWQARLKGPKK